MRILISGIHGFIGTNLVADLHKEHKIFGLSTSATPLEGVDKIFSWSDLVSVTLPEVDAVIHLAGIAHEIKGQSAAKEYDKVNVGLTAGIYDWFLGSGAEKFLFFSSVKAGANHVEDILTEDIEPTPSGLYGESKLKAEQYIVSHPVTSAKKVYILRPCLIHGPGSKGNLRLLIKAISKAGIWPLGAYDNQRSFLSTENLLFIIRALLETDVESGIYNLADDRPVSTNTLVKIIGDVLGKKTRIVRISPKIIKTAAKIGDAFNLPLDSARLLKLTENYVVSNAKIKAAIAIDNLPTPSIAGLTDSIRAMSNIG